MQSSGKTLPATMTFPYSPPKGHLSAPLGHEFPAVTVRAGDTEGVTRLTYVRRRGSDWVSKPAPLEPRYLKKYDLKIPRVPVIPQVYTEQSLLLLFYHMSLLLSSLRTHWSNICVQRDFPVASNPCRARCSCTLAKGSSRGQFSVCLGFLNVF